MDLDLNTKDINDLQEDIMKFVDQWVHEEKTPIPHKQILVNMKKKGTKEFTTINAIHVLLRKGYIRRAVTISNKTFYVQLRRV